MASSVAVTGIGYQGSANFLSTACNPFEIDLLQNWVKAKPVAEKLGKKGLKYKDESSCLALGAGFDAFKSAGIDPLQDIPGSTGVIVCTNFNSLASVKTVFQTIREGGAQNASVMSLPSVSPNVIGSSLSIRFGLRGPSLTVTNGSSSGSDGIKMALRMIQSGRVDRMLVVGVEVYKPEIESIVLTKTGNFLPQPAYKESSAFAMILEKSAICSVQARCFLSAQPLTSPKGFLLNDSFHEVEVKGFRTFNLGDTYGNFYGSQGVWQGITASCLITEGLTKHVTTISGGHEKDHITTIHYMESNMYKDHYDG